MKAKKYADLSRELQEEHLANSIVLNLLVEKLSEITGMPTDHIIQEISEYSNRKVDDMTDDEIRKSIATFDRHREEIRKATGGSANGAVLTSSNNQGRKGFRKI